MTVARRISTFLGQEGQARGDRFFQPVENHHQGVLHAAFQAVGLAQAPLQFGDPVVQGVGFGRFFGLARGQPADVFGGGPETPGQIALFVGPGVLQLLGLLTGVDGLFGIPAGLFALGLGRQRRTPTASKTASTRAGRTDSRCTLWDKSMKSLDSL